MELVWPSSKYLPGYIDALEPARRNLPASGNRIPLLRALAMEAGRLIHQEQNQLEHAISTPTELASLVDYQTDSVVSRVIFRSPGGTVTLFAFAEGQGLSEHTNPNDALVHVLAGEVSVRVAGEVHRVREGEIIHLPPSVPHELVGGAAFKMLLTLLKRPETGSGR